jgi:hypothetical protein
MEAIMASKRDNKLVRVTSVKTGTKAQSIPGSQEFAGSPFNFPV